MFVQKPFSPATEEAMPDPIKPLGTDPRQPSLWQPLADWNKADIPPYSGVYRVRCALGGVAQPHPVPDERPIEKTVDAGNNVTNGGRMSSERFAHLVKGLDFDGVLYIGKAVCHQDRFWHLLQTWKKDSGQDSKSNHGSYNTWLRKKLRQKYPIADLQFRFVPISDVPWHPESPSEAQKLSYILWPQKGTDPSNLTVAASFAEEDSLLRKYLNFYGKLPILNTAYPHRDKMGGKEKTEWMERHLAGLEEAMPSEPEIELDDE